VQDIDFSEIDDEISKFSNDKMVREALDKGVDLKQYGRQIDDELRAAERHSVLDYAREADSIAALHFRLADCDAVLDSMESLLSGFQDHLGAISGEIRTLQEDSQSMSVRVKNRKSVQDKLDAFVAELVLPTALIKLICDAPVDEKYLDALILLSGKMQFASQQDQSLRAVADLQPHLRRLNAKAIGKVRLWILDKIASFKKPKTNVQMLQPNVLLKFRYFMDFLQENSPEAADDVRDNYTQTMSKVYFGHFKSYLGDLERLALEGPGKGDLLVPAEASGVASLFGAAAGKSGGPRDVFALGPRSEVLAKMNDNSLVTATMSVRVLMENLYRSFVKLLVDTATPEFLFEKDFFGSADMFNEVFAKSLAAGAEWVEQYVARSHDLVGLLLMTRVTNHFAMIMRSRRVRGLDAFFDRMFQALLPRFKLLIDANLRSLAEAKPKALFSGKAAVCDTMRRYASLAASLYQVGLNEDPEGVHERLRAAMGRLLAAMADLNRTPKHRLVFLIHNHDHLLATLRHARETAPPPVGAGSSAPAPAPNSDFAWAEDELKTYSTAFVEEELMDAHRRCFAKFISFVKEATDDKQQPREKPSAEAAEQVARDFAANWKAGFDAIKADIAENFPAGPTATNIFQQTLTQLVLYHSRFDLIMKEHFRGVSWATTLVPTQTIMHRVRELSAPQTSSSSSGPSARS
jgi:hypothetical protein